MKAFQKGSGCGWIAYLRAASAFAIVLAAALASLGEAPDLVEGTPVSKAQWTGEAASCRPARGREARGREARGSLLLPLASLPLFL